MVMAAAKERLFLSCDWGTTRFRLRLVERERLRVRAEHVSADGVLAIASGNPGAASRRRAFERVLRQGLRALGVANRPHLPLVLSGMASSTLGCCPLPYALLPVSLGGRRFVVADRRLAGREVRIVSGLASSDDVMRGEEVELVGLFVPPARRELAKDCLVVLPGTHSKHVRVRGGRITGFTTHPTGELFALLTQRATFCVEAGAGFHRRAFIEGVRMARKHPLGAAIFKTRVRATLGLLQPAHGADFLSGVLIGFEVAALPAATGIVLASGATLARRYALALRELRPPAGSLTIIPPPELARALVAGHARFLPDL